MIKGKAVILRTVKESDLDLVLQAYSDVRTRGDFEDMDLSTEPELRKQLAEDGFWSQDKGALHITDLKDFLLGFVAFWKPSVGPHRVGYEIAYAIFNPNNRGKGYASEAVSLFVPFLFETRNVERVQALTHPNNIASRRVLEKCGFKLEGTLRKMVLYRGRPADANTYSILREECGPLNDRLSLAA
jgi:RimJ/RimL family protein N-acetyltransferase